jgi:hypothetical protein
MALGRPIEVGLKVRELYVSVWFGNERFDLSIADAVLLKDKLDGVLNEAWENGRNA